MVFLFGPNPVTRKAPSDDELIDAPRRVRLARMDRAFFLTALLTTASRREAGTSQSHQGNKLSWDSDQLPGGRQGQGRAPRLLGFEVWASASTTNAPRANRTPSSKREASLGLRSATGSAGTRPSLISTTCTLSQATSWSKAPQAKSSLRALTCVAPSYARLSKRR
jgi:hypothetical protein